MRTLALTFLCASALMTAAQPPAPYQRLVFPKLRPVTLPKVETSTLPNGIKLYLLENHELPLISGFALIRTGNVFDPADKIGLAGITGSVMRTGGTTKKSGDDLDTDLENIAGSVESGIGETNGSVSFSALKNTQDQVLQIFHDVLVSSAFRQDKLDLAKSQAKSLIARRDDDPGNIPSREVESIIYGRRTPYGWQADNQTVDRIQRADLVAFHQRYYFPANIMIAVEGDFSAPEMKARITKLFEGWNLRQRPVPPLPEVKNNPQPGLYFYPRTDVTQTFFAIGHLGGLLSNKDFPALQVMGDILGGSFSSRLFKHVRTQLGYAYEINASWAAEYDHPGLFAISGSTKSASTVDTFKAIRQEVDRIRSSEVTAAELETSKQTTLNSFVFNFDSPSKTLNRLVLYDYYGYPTDFLAQYQKAITGVTRADILRVAKQYLTPDKLTYVAVGNPSELGKPLTEVGVPLRPIEPTTTAATPAPADRAAALALLHKIQQAMGGREALSKVKDATYQADAELRSPAGPLKAKQTSRWLAAGALRQDQQLPFGKISVYADDETGWIVSPQGSMALPPPVAKQMQYERFRYPLTLALSDSDPKRTLKLIAPDTIEISGEGGVTIQWQVDPATGLPVKQSYPSAALGGGSGMVEETYSDWKTVDGIKLPGIINITQNGASMGAIRIATWTLNSGLTREELSKKP